MCGFDEGDGGVCAIKPIFFAEGFCQSRGADVTIKDFSAFLD